MRILGVLYVVSHLGSTLGHDTSSIGPILIIVGFDINLIYWVLFCILPPKFLIRSIVDNL